MKELIFAKKLTNILDTKFKIGRFSFGIDPLLNIYPWLGSFIGAVTSLYIFWTAYKIDVPFKVYVIMIANIFIDFWLGSVPVIGIVFDALYKGNLRNLKLVEKYYNID